MGNNQSNFQRHPKSQYTEGGGTIHFKQLGSEVCEEEIIFQVKGANDSTFTKFIAGVPTCRKISVIFRALIDTAPTKLGNPVIFLKDFEPRLFCLVLKYFYFDESELSPGQALSLRKAAYRYKIKSIFDVLDQIITHSLKVENFCEVFSAYSQMNDLKLMCSCLKILPLMRGNHLEILSSSAFLLLKLDPGLRSLILSKSLKVDSSALWERCLDWHFNQQNSSPGRNSCTSVARLRRLFTCAEFSTQILALTHWLSPISEDHSVPMARAPYATCKRKLTPRKCVIYNSNNENISGSFETHKHQVTRAQVVCKKMGTATIAEGLELPGH